MNDNKQKIRAVLWDKMHYMLRRFNDRMIHISLNFDGDVNEETMSKAIKYMIDNVPILHSSYRFNFFKSYWQVCDYDIKDVFSLSESDNFELDVNEFLLNEIPFDSNVQIKIAIFKNLDSFVFALIVNHQCFDGGDLINFLKDLFKNYSLILSNQNEKLSLKSGSRSHREIYHDLSKTQKIVSKLLFRYDGKISNEAIIAFDKKCDNDKQRIITMQIPDEIMDHAYTFTKEHHVTINDVLTAALIHSLYSICLLKDNEPLAISCAVNLRRKRNDKCLDTGYTNHTAWMTCFTDYKPTKPLELILNINKQTTIAKEDPYLGLYSLPLLNLAFYILPLAIADKLASVFYANPYVAMSNIGRVDKNEFLFTNADLKGGYIVGTMKDKPHFMFTVSTFAGKTTFGTAINGTDKDQEKINSLMYMCMSFLENI